MEVGFVGRRGMVGSVSVQRMKKEDGFAHTPEAFSFTTSNTGGAAPDFGQATKTLLDANDVAELAETDIIVTCQGSNYAKFVSQPLHDNDWNGYWADAASPLRMKGDAVIVLDPVNRDVIDSDLENSAKNYIGGDCTASLVPTALGGLFQNDLVEWATSITYQVASGAGAKNVRELISGMSAAHAQVADEFADLSSTTFDTDRRVPGSLRNGDYPKANFGVPLTGSLIPWTDMDSGNGQPEEEWKGGVEANKILGHNDSPITIDGLCVRVNSMRYHSQTITLRPKKNLPVSGIEAILAGASDWVKIIPDEEEASIHELAPVEITSTLSVPVGRTRKLEIGGEYISMFTVGDQLLQGAAEPLRRALRTTLSSL